MSEENTPEANENQEVVEREPMPLLERLQRCKSRKAARESIAEFCEENGHDPKFFALSTEELFVFSSLK